MSQRRGGKTLHITAAEAVDLENRARGRINKLMTWNISTYVPVVAWFLWILTGTLFYTFHDSVPLAKGFYQSVNVGWVMSWDTKPMSSMNDTTSKLYSIFHISAGVVFLGVVVMFVAKKMAEGNGRWIDTDSLVDATHAGKQVDELQSTQAVWQLYLPSLPILQRYVQRISKHVTKFRLIYLLLLWVVVGLVWASVTVKRWSEDMVFDFVLSTLTGAGYVVIPPDSTDSAYVFVAFYTALGVPITAVAIGIMLSFSLATPETGDIVQKIMAEVTPEEVDFLEHTGIESDSGLLDHQSFLILAAIRMGTASPELIIEIIARFTLLDRKRKNKIAYDDLVVGGCTKSVQKVSIRNITKSRKFQDMKESARLSRSSMEDSQNPRWKSNNTLSLPVAMKLTAKLIHLKKHAQIFGSVPAAITSVGGGGCAGKSNESISGQNSPTKDVNMHRQPSTAAPSLRTITIRRNGLADLELFVHPIRMLRVQRNRIGVQQESQSRRRVTPSETCNADSDGEAKVEDVDELVDHEIKSSCGIGPIPPQNGQQGGSQNAEDKCDVDSDDSISQESDCDSLHVRYAWVNGPSVSNATNPPLLRDPDTAVSPPRPGIPQPPAPLYSMPALINHLVVHGRLKKKYKMKKQGGIRMERTRLPITTLERIIYLARLVSHDSNIRFFSAWFFWVIGGCTFFSVYEGHSIQEAVYRSVSFGYGLFWVSQEHSELSKIYVRVHFLLGIFAINVVRALFAKKVTETDAQWYHDVKMRTEMDEIFSNSMSSNMEMFWAWKKYYFPKLRVYILFVVWLLGGIIFGAYSMNWNFVDSLFFSVSVMATGTFMPVGTADGGDAFRHLFVSVYVIVGVPLMTVCTSLLANTITGLGGAQIVRSILSSNISAMELDMMQAFGIVDGAGYINRKEYTILVLVRMGVLLPSMIKYINSVFVNMDKGAVHSMNSADLAAILTADAKNGEELLNSLRMEVARATRRR